MKNMLAFVSIFIFMGIFFAHNANAKSKVEMTNCSNTSRVALFQKTNPKVAAYSPYTQGKDTRSNGMGQKGVR
ncbi:MAG: hypothetical protein NZ480_01425 [Bdellovibrionaceae bacterium]|nr:hypothetical protein [Pseudobdellovibrionaceae bacterium]MDW8190170.1 hypothetical protein [Pseudobdellovibrionaceae bacterium]